MTNEDKKIVADMPLCSGGKRNLSGLEHSGLEKIKPIAHELTRMSFTTADMNIALKLNEVIEKVNLMMEVMNKGVEEMNQIKLLESALWESLKLQSHYAKLLNQYDGGSRMTFNSVHKWITRLQNIGTIPKDEAS
jgi:hypothetical protein